MKAPLSLVGLILNTAASLFAIWPLLNIKKSIKDDLVSYVDKDGYYTQNKHLKDRKMAVACLLLLSLGFVIQIVGLEGLSIDLEVPLRFFGGLLQSSTFWIVVSSITSLIIAWAAVAPIIEKSRLGIALFEDALQIDVLPDGVLTIHNIFNEPIIIQNIGQKLFEGKKDFDLDPDSGSTKIAEAIRRTPLSEVIAVDHLSKRIAPNSYCTYAGTLTHLPRGFERESLWVVRTKIVYASTKKTVRTIQATHRFSITLEPTKRWVENF